VKTLRTDCGKEFCNAEFDLLLEREGITRETNTPYTPQQNGYIERDNKTICEAARSMLHHSVPLKLWVESVHTSVYLLNLTINNQVGFTTSYELRFNVKLTVSHYRTFGILLYLLTKSLRTKFQTKGTMVVFIGYSDTSKGWRFWNPSNDVISESFDVIFYETLNW
jgi:transposase InsO family protein